MRYNASRKNNVILYFMAMLLFIIYMCNFLSKLLNRTESLDSPPSQSIQGYIYVAEDRNEIDKMEIDRIDLKYCNGPCRFLNLYHIPEQGKYSRSISLFCLYTICLPICLETRAQVHVRHFAFTAGLLNRTLILPNVENSRIGSCLSHPFDYYYDVKWADSNSDSFKYITMDNFKAWLIERKKYQVPASDQLMSIYDFEHDPNPKVTDRYRHCFHNYTVPKSRFNEVMAWEPNLQEFRKIGEQRVIKFLRGRSIEGTSLFEHDDTEIIHVDVKRGYYINTIQKFCRYLFYLFIRDNFSHNPKAKERIKYSSELLNLADQTADQLGPYVAVHWRMETIRHTQNLVGCAKGLVQTIINEPIYQNLSVFLLTDYPHSFSEEQQTLAIEDNVTKDDLDQWLYSTSDTFHRVLFTPNHHMAIRMLYKNYPFTLFETKITSQESIKNWNLLAIPEHLKKSNNRNKAGLIDSGWLGILDKLTAIRSRYFIAGEPFVCARRSTFTAQIMDEKNSRSNSAEPIRYFRL